jgi:exodeoxyribonuclease V beta subunit
MSRPRRHAAGPEHDEIGALDPLAVPLVGTTLIEASAGTGKTHTITTLYARLLLEAGLGVEQILVVTYTNAATAELRARIRSRLHALVSAFDGKPIGDDDLARLVDKRRDSGCTEADRARLLAALHGFDQSAIFTIHSFCQRMLQEHAFESGVSFDVDFLSDQRALLDQIVRDFWIRELHNASPAFVAYVRTKKECLQQLERLAAVVDTYPDLQIVSSADQSDDELHSRWLRLQLDCAEYVRHELRHRKDIGHQQSFNDLLQRLAEALRRDGGEVLAERIRKRLRAALIDEFQDTDPLQYEIFRRIFHEAPGAALFLIGDPKQAIYAFRGADVFAYLAAKRDAAGVHTLRTNWRSDPSLVQAINTLFTRNAPFVLADIPFLPAHAQPAASDQLTATGGAANNAPFEILFVRRWGQEGKQGALTKGWADQALAALVASEIVRFVSAGALIGNRAVAFADIAVLCRTNDQAIRMQEALRTLGVPGVLQTEASVFKTAEAQEVGRMLWAMAEPTDLMAVRAAMATTLLGQTAEDLWRLQSDERAWDDWLRRFQDWNQTWLKRGFVAAFRRLLEMQEVIPRLLGLVDGERRLTNVLQLMELLHSATIEEHLGPAALAHWLTQMGHDEETRSLWVGEAAQIRLESDDAAVKLVTIHKSKGLQYPIVYCPYLWDGKLLHPNDNNALRFHDPDDNNQLKLDLGSHDFQAHKKLAEREALAENLRLLYVALTRAQHRCSIVWGPFGAAPDSALGYLLHREPDAVDPVDGTVRRIKGFNKQRDDAGMRADLEQLAASACGGIAVRDLPRESGELGSVDAAPSIDLACRVAQRRLGLTWRTASFSSLIRSASTLSQPAQEGVDHDATADTPESVPAAGGELIVLHDFPAGTRSGQVLHGIFEQLDFRVADAASLRQQVAAALDSGGIEARWAEPVSRAIGDVLATPLDDTGLRLRDVPKEKRLNELEFLFPVALGEQQVAGGENQLGLWQTPQQAVPFTPKRLAHVFATHARLPFAAEYANRLAQLDFNALAGFLKGYIDLIFEHDGRWYVVDYKSNRLGPTAAAYAPERLALAMTAHHYVLQYHLYAVALHRHLTARLPGYDYNRHFGGVFYLFVRGMAPGHPRSNGIFHDRPPRRLIERLSESVDGCGETR